MAAFYFTVCIFPLMLKMSFGLKCQSMLIPMCYNVGYNYTKMPNQFSHATQEEAGLEVHQFWPLVKINCAEELKFFLCSLYFPRCEEHSTKSLPPCKRTCEKARAGCQPLMQSYGFEWPPRMNCNSLPSLQDRSDNGEPLCIEAPTVKPEIKPPAHSCNCTCKYPSQYTPSKSDTTKCAIACQSNYFSTQQHHLAALWIAFWSIICLLSSILVLLTFLIDPFRFRYPQRPIVCLAGCYSLVAIGYLARLILGSVGCTSEVGIVRSGIGFGNFNASCILVFILVYYCSSAAALWWVLLAVTWFLAAALKWSSEAIARCSVWFHAVAWITPGILSFIVLMKSEVDGDPLSGVCSVGNNSLWSQRVFVVAPLMSCLVVGTGFLLGGFICLFRIRHVIKSEGNGTQKLEQLMLRIGVFSLLYTIPVSVLVFCYYYEQIERESWEKALSCNCNPRPETHLYSILMLRYFMSLAVGITSGCWIWTGKTLSSWNQFLNKLGSSRGKNVKKLAPLSLTHV